MFSYQVAGPSEYLAITGRGIEDIKLEKRAFIWPFQRCIKFDIAPENYTFHVQAMSAEKLPFNLPAVYTIGPRVQDEEALLLYAKLMSPHDKNSHHVKELVKGVIEGETRVLAASMTMEEIFKDSKKFKEEVFHTVQRELDQFGLFIYNANVQSLEDVPGHEYFSYLGQKTQMEAANRAKIAVAEARMKGDIGSKEREGQTTQNTAKINAETKILETQRQGEAQKEEVKVRTDVKIFENKKEAELAIANAELATKKASLSQTAELAQVEAEKAVALREAELQSQVEKKNALTQTEKLKAQLLSQATVEYQTKVQVANSELYKKQKEADGEKASADASFYGKKQAADAELYARKQAADAELYARKKEAEGMVAVAQAEGNYVKSILEQFDGNYAAFRDYMIINKNMIPELANINAQAIHGLQPKISIWSNGNHEDVINYNNGELKDVAGVYRMLPPLFKTLQEQTGMLPPFWLGSLPAEAS